MGGRETARNEINKASDSAKRVSAQREQNRQALATSLGQYGQGNIDLYNRPQYRNSDGSVSTVRSMGFNDGTGEILIPTVANVNGRPTMLSDDQAIDRYYNTGEYLGKFNSVNAANNYADMLHRQQEAMYTQPNPTEDASRSYYLKALQTLLNR